MSIRNTVILLCLTLCTTLQIGCVPIVAVTAAKVGSIALEERTAGRVVDDAVILTKIKQKFALENQRILTNTSVDVLEGKVLLTGNLQSYEDIKRAIEIAWSIEGIKEVVSELETQEKDVKTRAKDRFIAAQIRTKILFKKNVRSVNYTIDVNNGNVYILGFARSPEELNYVVKVARTVSGVKKVINYTTIRDV